MRMQFATEGVQGQLDDLSADLATLSSAMSLHLFQVIWYSDEWRLNANSTSSA